MMNSNIAMTTADLQNHNTLYGNTTYGGMRNSHTMNSMKTDEDEMDFQDNKSETSSLSGGGKSKVFQCTGYGECNMVFTRSEHLARHMRKHTGEKPFKCVVSGCERMFSRFDNMMQHTQTHNKARGGPRRTKPKTKRGGKKASGTSRRASSSDDYDDYGPFPSPPPSRTNSSMNLIKEQHIILPNPKYVQIDEDEDEDMLISEDDQSTQQPPPPPQQQYRNPYPTSPSSSSESSYEYTQPIRRRRSAPRVHYQPYPTNKYTEQAEILPVLPRRNSALSQLANYLVNNPDQSPESYLTKHNTSPPNLTMTRRLSIQDLSNPIEEMDGSKLDLKEDTTNVKSDPPRHEEGVDLTEDEYQAIQGFGQFYRSAITCNK